MSRDVDRNQFAPGETRHHPRCFWIVTMALGLMCHAASAQDLRVLTRVSVQQPQDGRWQPISRSLTLFHGGRVYDHVEEIGEVVIHEPTESQFVILSLTGNKMATRVRYEELHRFLEMARKETTRYMQELSASPRGNPQQVIEALAFQLEPQFREAFDASAGTVEMASRFLTYRAETLAVERPGLVARYLEWADWTARLNSVLHPQAVTPEARLELNRALRSHNRLPTQVDLTLRIEGESRLRAEHTFDWPLRTLDRDFIARWEKIRNATDLRWVDLREYQRTLLTSSQRPGR